jgi:hypothetical protein
VCYLSESAVRRALGAAALCCWIACVTGRAEGAVLVLSGTSVTEDSTLYSDNTSDNAGGADRMRVGATLAHGSRRALIKFDVSGAPSGSIVTSVALTLLMVEAPATGPANTPQSLHRVTNSWVEGNGIGSGAGGQVIAGTVTWNSREHGSLLWTSPGGDFTATASATATVGNVTFQPVTWADMGLVADVQAWLNAPSQNFGWVLIGDETTLQSARGYAASEDLATANQPVLVVTYTPPAAVRDWHLY